MRPKWTFLTNHAQVFLCVTQNARLTAREIAATVGITERAVQRILSDLEQDGYVQAFREGRSNRYATDLDKPLRHPAQHGQRVGDLLEQIMHETSHNTHS
ncbi:transcriptional regulator [Dictyobacter alpinus]|uniref:Transcriptional regulator n=1 Tax=Dictyobacter alpinus TaxID=2014873 RepID=A0A402BEW1_9CHLR|nr:winged helix-turn-helix domain-containing protein [Dictyobacter alpinus]GCE29836.1 transcriptional regulator [Dictyobacter alpinus]